jgi:hypothetical protein
VSLRAHVLWAFCLSALAVCACAPEKDLVALRRTASLCGDAGCPTSTDAGCPTCVDAGCSTCTDASYPTCGAADSCMTDARCADAAICRPPAPTGICSTRACSALSSQAEFCSDTGSAFALGDGCATSNDNPRFRYAICSLDSLQTQQRLSVRGDVAVDGDVSIEDTANILGTLFYAKTLRQSRPTLLTAERTERGAPRCTPQDGLQLDIANAVKARANDNDNAAAGGAIERMRHFTGDLSLNLPCGRYYVTGLEGTGQVVIHAQGNLALFIDGNVQLERHLRIEAEGTARISVLVSGAFNVAHEGVQLGQLADARHLLAVARQVHLESDGESVIGGALYAPASELLSTHKLSASGALFVGSARLFGETDLDYAPAATFAADSCGP